MIGILLALLARLMCGFCHAPEHAYDTLLENPEISRDGLCPEAQERLCMAATPYPTTAHIDYLWDEATHEWRAYRQWGACERCPNRTWRYPHEANALMICAACAKDEAWRRDARRTWPYPPPTGQPLPRQGKAPKGWLTFSDYEVRDTRDFENIPGARYGKPRPKSPYAPLSPPPAAAQADEPPGG